MDRLGNLLHALATAVAEQHALAMTAETQLSASAVATVLTLGQHDGQSLSDLASITGLSHSATVRLIDRLESDGLVQRSTQKQGRNVPVFLTHQGRTAYETLRLRQSGFLDGLLADLSQEDKDTLERILERLLSKLTTSRAARDHICRNCDEGICEQASCPVEVTYLQMAARG